MYQPDKPETANYKTAFMVLGVENWQKNWSVINWSYSTSIFFVGSNWFHIFFCELRFNISYLNYDLKVTDR